MTAFALPLLMAATVTGVVAESAPLDPARHPMLVDDWGWLSARHGSNPEVRAVDARGGRRFLTLGKGAQLRVYALAGEKVVGTFDDLLQGEGIPESNTYSGARLLPVGDGFGILWTGGNSREGTYGDYLALFDRRGRRQRVVRLVDLSHRDRPQAFVHLLADGGLLVVRHRPQPGEPLRVSRLDGRGTWRWEDLALAPELPTTTLQGPTIGTGGDGAFYVVAPRQRKTRERDETPYVLWRITSKGALGWKAPVHLASLTTGRRSYRQGFETRPHPMGIELYVGATGVRVHKSGRTESVVAEETAPGPQPALFATLPTAGRAKLEPRQLGVRVPCPLMKVGRGYGHRVFPGLEPPGLGGCQEVDLGVQLPASASAPVVLVPFAGAVPVRIELSGISGSARMTPPGLTYGHDHAQIMWRLTPSGLESWGPGGLAFQVRPPHRPRVIGRRLEILDAKGRVVLTLVPGQRDRAPSLSAEGGAVRIQDLRGWGWMNMVWLAGQQAPASLGGSVALPLGDDAVFVAATWRHPLRHPSVFGPDARPVEPARVLELRTRRWRGLPDWPEGFIVRDGVRLADGRLLVGGWSVPDAGPRLGVVDPKTGRVTPVSTTLPAAPDRLLVVDPETVIIASEPDPAHERPASLHRLALGTGAWTPVPPSAALPYTAVAALEGGRVLVVGSPETPKGSGRPPATGPKTAVLDGASLTWTEVAAPSPQTRPIQLHPVPGGALLLGDNRYGVPFFELASGTWINAPTRFWSGGAGLVPSRRGRTWLGARYGDQRQTALVITDRGDVLEERPFDTRPGADAVVAFPDGTSVVFGGGDSAGAGILLRRGLDGDWKRLVAW